MALGRPKTRMSRRVSPVLDPPVGVPPEMGVDESAGVNVAKLMSRHNRADRLQMGQMMEDLLKKPEGELVCRTIHHMKSLTLHESLTMNTRSEIIVGRLQAFEQLLTALENYVMDKRNIMAKIREEQEIQEQEEE